MEHIVEFNFEVWRPTLDGGEATKELALKISVDVNIDVGGEEYYVTVLEALDDDGEEVPLTQWEEDKIAEKAVDTVQESRYDR